MTFASQADANPSEIPVDVKPLAEISRLARIAASGPIPDAIRRLRRAAASVDADGFALFFVGRGLGVAKLMPCFDESFPARSVIAPGLMGQAAEPLLRHIAGSSLPAAWGMAASQPHLVGLPTILADRMGLVLPVSADPAHSGVFVLTGEDLQVDASGIEELHLTCFEIFTTVAQLKSNSITSASSISRRELECLVLTAAGRTSEDTARILGLSIHTANQYLTTAAGKLDAVNRTQAVAKAIRLGLIE